MPLLTELGDFFGLVSINMPRLRRFLKSGETGHYKKSIFEAREYRVFLSTHEMPVFVDRNHVIFTKIHQTEKSCQSYRRFQNPIYFVVRWRPFFDNAESGVRNAE